MSDDRAPGISVVIPNYNGRALLERNLPSVKAALAQTSGQQQVIVSDDASTDDSVAFLEANYPEIIIVRNPLNRGFAATINAGIRMATLELVLLLNSDIFLLPGYFEHQLHYFSEPATFGVMGKILDTNGRLSEAAKYPLRSVFKINKFRETEPAVKNPFTYYLSGANALVDRRKLQVLGGFNELYSPFYQEDLDLSLRAWQLGWRCYYEPAATCTHEVSTTIAAHNRREYIGAVNTRNKFILHYLHLRGMRRLLWAVTSVFGLLFRWIGRQTYYYKGAFAFLGMLAPVRNARREFSRLRRTYDHVSLSEIKKLIRAHNTVSPSR